jgi:hypothetical protein
VGIALAVTDIRESEARLAQRKISTLRLGGLLSAVGALGVVVTSAFYVASPPSVAGPVQPFDLAAAMSGALHGAATLKAAGIFGVFADLIWATGALLLAQEFARVGRSAAAAGWIAIFLSVVIFIFVDGMTGFVLPQLAAADNSAGFMPFKQLWDLLFLLGTAAYGAGAMAILGGDRRSENPLINGALSMTGFAVACVGFLAALMGFAGVTAVPTDRLCGGSIALGSLLFIGVSIQIALSREAL